MKIIVSGEAYVDRVVWSESESVSRAWPLDTPAVCQRRLDWRDRLSGALGVVEILKFLGVEVGRERFPSTFQQFVWRAARLDQLATDLAPEKKVHLGKRWRFVEASGWGPETGPAGFEDLGGVSKPNPSPTSAVEVEFIDRSAAQPRRKASGVVTVLFGGLPQGPAVRKKSPDVLVWRPLARGYGLGIQTTPFWQSEVPIQKARTVVVVDSDYLRLVGEPIGKRLSLDQAIDQVSKVMTSRVSKTGLLHIVVCLGPFACLYYSREEPKEKHTEETGWRQTVLFLPRFDVDRFGAKSGWMAWFDEWIVAVLAQSLAKKGGLDPRFVKGGLKRGLSRTAHLAGGLKSLGSGSSTDWRSVWCEHFDAGMPKHVRPVESVEYDVASEPEGRPCWVYGPSSMVGHALASTEGRSAAQTKKSDVHGFDRFLLEVVDQGIFKVEDGSFPVVRFGDLVLVDRNEIDHYRGLRNLLEEYLLNPNWTKPLSIAVFGPPGSGKSFGVTEIAKAMSESFNLDRRHLVFNLSQFESSDDLSAAFHRVQDACLDEKIPIAFFDEFDSDKEGRPLGWLKHFLMPMQDGEFTERGATHKLKKCILVFAGGTSRSYEQFSAKVPNRSFVEAKGPDFLSRLRGHVNNKGLSLLKASDDTARTADRITQLRRAIFLRSLLKSKLGYRSGGEEKNLNINEDFIRPFLYVEDFRHGMRSVEAIIQMCQINDLGNGLNRGSLPIASLLDMHVDAIKFRAAQRQ